MSLSLFGLMGMDFNTACYYTTLMGGMGGNSLLPLILMGGLGGLTQPSTSGTPSGTWMSGTTGSTLQLGGGLAGALVLSKLMQPRRRYYRPRPVYINRRYYYGRRRRY